MVERTESPKAFCGFLSAFSNCVRSVAMTLWEGVGIVRRLLEVEVHEFEERTEVFRCRATRQTFGVFSEADTETNLLAGEFLLQFGGGEVAPAGGVHDGFDEFAVEHVFVGKLVATAPTVGPHENLRVVEVCFLEEDTCSVGERPLRVAEGALVVLTMRPAFGNVGTSGSLFTLST